MPPPMLAPTVPYDDTRTVAIAYAKGGKKVMQSIESTIIDIVCVVDVIILQLMARSQIMPY